MSITALIEKSWFPKVRSVELEHRKLGIVRILFGTIIFIRQFEIFYVAQFISSFNEYYAFAIIALAITACFTIGFLVPLTTLLMIVSLPLFDGLYSTSTLGTAISLQFLFVLLFTNHGRYYSIDNLTLRNPGLSFVPRKLYGILGDPAPARLTIIYFLGFFAYALVSFGALSQHLQDANWLQGKTISLFLVGAYLSAYYSFFRGFALNFPAAFEVLSVLVVIGQSIFQFLMLPLMWLRIGFIFVLVWGFSFFIASLFLINLSYLPHIEILFWLAVFTRSGIREPIVMLYDDKCNLCRRSVNVLKVLNFNGRIVFTGLSVSDDIIREYNLDREHVRVWLYGLKNGKIYVGYDLYYQIVKANPLLWVLIPFFILGRITRVGYWIYALIAKNRYKLLGTCEINFSKPKPAAAVPAMRRITFRGIIILYLIISVIYVFFEFPILSKYTKYAGRHAPPLFNAAEYVIYNFGYDMPVVFNETDLLMNEKYFVLYRVYKNQKELVPIFSVDGCRLDYFGGDKFSFMNHGSDLLYFGTTLSYARNIINVTPEEFHQKGGKGDVLVKKIASFDKEYNNLDSTVQYYFEVRKNYCITGEDSMGAKKFDSDIIFSNTISSEELY